VDSWIYLVVGSFAAVGAALALGTLAALVRYHRRGEFPHQASRGGFVTRRTVVGMWARVGAGVVVAVAGVAALAARGLV
jgi:hypothetical protein